MSRRICYKKSYHVNHTFTHNEKILMDVFCDEIYECITYARLIRSLDNKDSILYRTLSAIRKIEEGEEQYIEYLKKYLFLWGLENITN